MPLIIELTDREAEKLLELLTAAPSRYARVADALASRIERLLSADRRAG